MLKLTLVALAVFILNIPFGYWRGSLRKLSLPWFLAIHLPVPLVIAIRHFSGLGWQLWSFPVVILAFFAGQYLGGKLYQKRLATRAQIG